MKEKSMRWNLGSGVVVAYGQLDMYMLVDPRTILHSK